MMSLLRSVTALASIALTACAGRAVDLPGAPEVAEREGEGEGEDTRAFPTSFTLAASASLDAKDGNAVSCTLSWLFNVTETSRTADAVVYDGDMSGEVFRTLSYPDKTGFEFQAVVFGETTVTLTSDGFAIDIPVNTAEETPYWHEQGHFEGEVSEDGLRASGDWLCAPLNVTEETAGFEDTTLSAPGDWSTEPATEELVIEE